MTDVDGSRTVISNGGPIGSAGRSRTAFAAGVLAFSLFWGPATRAEPYLAVRSKLRCSSCHMNMTGGGERNAQGRMYTQGTLSHSQFDSSEGFPLLTGEVAGFLTAGADLRLVNNTVRPPRRDGKTSNEFKTEEANVYLTARVWRNRLFLHLDEKIAPGGAQNREAFLLCNGLPKDGWIKVGRFFAPYGTRLYDDSAFIRNAAGFSFQAPDDGVEVGFEPGKYSLAAAVTNGAGGGSENDASKQISFHAARLMGAYRLGISGSNNVTGGSRTSLGGVFGGAAIGNFVFLAEGDIRFDKSAGGSKTQWIGYVEEYWEITRGFNLRLSHEYLDPNRDIETDERTRSGLGFDWYPVPSLEIDARFLYLRGPRQFAGQNDWSFQAGAHLFF